MKDYKDFRYKWTLNGWRVHFPTGFKTYIVDLTQDQETELKQRFDSFIGG